MPAGFLIWEDQMGEFVEKVLTLKHCADYQDSSVVSREIMKSPRGNVSFFAFDKGESLSEHTSPYNAMVYVVEGRVEIKIAGKPYNLSEGEMIIMPADKPHALEAVENFKMLLVMIK